MTLLNSHFLSRLNRTRDCFTKWGPVCLFIKYMRVASSYIYMWGEKIGSTSHSNVPCGLQYEWLTSCTQIMLILRCERRIGNRNGKAYFLVSVPKLLVWKHINNSSYSGAQQVQKILTPCKDYLKHVRWGKGAKEPGRSFLPWVYLSHTGKSHTHRSFMGLE